MATREWDAATYDRIADAHAQWGAEVLDRLVVADGAAVLDAGCGSGRVTEQLLDRFPTARVVALDGSAAMLAQASERLARFGDRVRFVEADLTQPLAIGESVDAVLSTATFHWIADHDALFASLAGALCSGGQFVGQWGGGANTANVLAALRHVGDGWEGPWHFAGPDDTEHRLRVAGFEVQRISLEARPVSFPDNATFRQFLRTVILGAHLDRMAPGDHDGFVAAVAERLPDRTVDYVRLNVVANRV